MATAAGQNVLLEEENKKFHEQLKKRQQKRSELHKASSSQESVSDQSRSGDSIEVRLMSDLALGPRTSNAITSDVGDQIDSVHSYKTDNVTVNSSGNREVRDSRQEPSNNEVHNPVEDSDYESMDRVALNDASASTPGGNGARMGNKPVQSVPPLPERGTPGDSQQIVMGQQIPSTHDEDIPQNDEKYKTVQDLPLDKCIPDGTTSPLLDKLTRMLDREHRVISNWHHLAHYFGATSEVTSSFEINLEQSPTEELLSHLQTSKPELTVGDLEEKLKLIHRNDIIQKLIDKMYQSTWNVADLVSGLPSDPKLSIEFLQLLKEKLDADNPFGNWKHLAGKFHIPKNIIDKFGVAGHGPTEELLLHLRVSPTFSDLKIKQLREHLKDMNRYDVVQILKGITDDQLVKDAVLPKSTLHDKVCERLDKEQRSINNWKHLAYRLGIPRVTYESFDGSKGKAKSPTKLLLRWVTMVRPGVTVGALQDGLKKIERYDVYEALQKGAEEVLAAIKNAELENIAYASHFYASGPPGPNPYGKSCLAPQQNCALVPYSLPAHHSVPRSRGDKLKMKASEMPLRVYSRVCAMLDAQKPFWDDYRMLGEAFGLSRAWIEKLAQSSANPTHVILSSYSQGATVEKLMEILQQESFNRQDVMQEIQSWVEAKEV